MSRGLSHGSFEGVTSDLPTPKGDLADLRPVVATDSREQQPLCFTRLESCVVTLPTADYGLYQVPSAAAIERKASLDELFADGGRAPYWRHLSAFEVRYDLPICYFQTPEAAALQSGILALVGRSGD